MRLLLSLRAALAIAAGLVLTFVQSHSSLLGLFTFAGFAAVSAILVPLASLLFARANFLESLAQGAVNAIAAIFSWFMATNADQTIQSLLWCVSSWAVIIAVLELYFAKKQLKASAGSKERNISATLALLLAIAYLVIGFDETSSVGLLSAYLVLSGVHLGISAASETAK
ncbi:MAG: hypothetical protein RL556_143 [Actinomycetota bacterium]